MFVRSFDYGIYHKVFHKVAGKYPKWGRSHELLIRNLSYLDHGFLGRPASSAACHEFWPHRPCPGVGLEIKI